VCAARLARALSVQWFDIVQLPGKKYGITDLILSSSYKVTVGKAEEWQFKAWSDK